MANDLLDFTKRDNFEFLEFAKHSNYSENEELKGIFKRKCENVLEYAHATVQDMCLLGFHLSELKNSKTWEHVIEPKSKTAFFNFTFADFCEYAFGISKTKTSDLLRIAAFVKISGTKTGFIEERYSKYNTSQLVELASVREEDRKYFNPEMPVSEIRKIKDYMRNGLFCMDKHEADFDLKKKTEEYHERKNKKEEVRSDVIPGQIELGKEIFETDATEENPTSDFSTKANEIEKFWSAQEYDKGKLESELREEGVSESTISKIMKIAEEDEELPEHSHSSVSDEEEQEEDIYDMPMQTHSYDSDYSPEEEQEEKEDEEACKYNFSTQKGVRKFLKDFRNWEKYDAGNNLFFEKTYCFRLKNGVSIFATVEINIDGNDGELNCTKEKISYYICDYIASPFYATRYKRFSKKRFEDYCKLHKDEL